MKKFIVLGLLLSLAACARTPDEINIDPTDVDGKNLYARDTTPAESYSTKKRRLGWH